MPSEAFPPTSPAGARLAAPVVSVIMPAWNAAATLGRTLASLVGQSMPAWEALVVDDASTDGTWAEIERWMAADPRVRGFRLPCNGKAAAARNHALAAARGAWIAIVDADDWIAPDRLEALTGAAEARGCDIIADNLLLFDAAANLPVGAALAVDGAAFPLDLNVFLAHCITGISRFDYGMLKPLVRRAFLERSRVRYESGCLNGHDFHFMLDLLAAGARAVVLPEPRYVYVQPYGAASRRLANEDRSHYRYDIMRRYNDLAIARYGPTLNARALRCLRRRSAAIARFAAYLAAKDALAGHAPGRAFATVLRRPGCLLPALAALLVRTGLARRVHRLPATMPDIMRWGTAPAPSPVREMA